VHVTALAALQDSDCCGLGRNVEQGTCVLARRDMPGRRPNLGFCCMWLQRQLQFVVTWSRAGAWWQHAATCQVSVVVATDTSCCCPGCKAWCSAGSDVEQGMCALARCDMPGRCLKPELCCMWLQGQLQSVATGMVVLARRNMSRYMHATACLCDCCPPSFTEPL
jgi:hypothetical protein